jgi:ATP-dependent RNA helicase DeaD
MLDLINRGAANLSKIEILVLDEADEMLNMGFKDELDGILQDTPETKQTLLFSATMPKEVASIAKNYMNEPTEITVGKRNSGAENVRHVYYTVHSKDRYLALKRILDFNPNIYGIVFCRTREETKLIADHLIQDGYNADALHGDLSQSQRDYVMSRYRSRVLQILVATDVAARGIDVDDVTHVINYNLPDDPEVYTHRSGRTGRAGKSGISIIILSIREKGRVREFERIINKKIDHEQVPDGYKICEKQLFHLIDRMEKVDIDEVQIESYMPAVMRKLEWLDKEDLIKHFVSLEFNRFLNYYRDAEDINVDERSSDRGKRRDNDNSFKDRDGNRDSYSEGRSRDKSRSRSPEAGYARFFINVGKKDGIKPSEILKMINEATNDRDIRVGVIDLMSTYSFFEATERSASKILNSFHDINFNGRDVRVELAGDAPQGGDTGNSYDEERSEYRPKRERWSEGGRGRGGDFRSDFRGGDRGGDRGGRDYGRDRGRRR